jgi:hypothetical protein
MAGWRQPGRRSLKSISVTGFLKVPYQSFVTGKSGAVIIAEGLSRQDVESGCRPEFLAAVGKIATNLVRRHQTSKASLKGRRLMAAWDNR